MSGHNNGAFGGPNRQPRPLQDRDAVATNAARHIGDTLNILMHNIAVAVNQGLEVADMQVREAVNGTKRKRVAVLTFSGDLSDELLAGLNGIVQAWVEKVHAGRNATEVTVDGKTQMVRGLVVAAPTGAATAPPSSSAPEELRGGLL